jgi:hypothetical protein
MWDGLLGNGTSAGSIGTDVGEFETIMKAQAADIDKKIQAHVVNISRLGGPSVNEISASWRRFPINQ